MNYASLGRISTIRETSYDSEHDEYMTDSEVKVTDFDRVKTDYMNKLGLTEENAHSVDALAKGIEGSLFYLVEFKNGNCKNEAQGINLKIRDTLLILCDICGKKISDTRESIIFVLVYNSSRTDFTSQDRYAIAMANKSGQECPKFGLDKISGTFVKKVLMLDAEEFCRKIIPVVTDI